MADNFNYYQQRTADTAIYPGAGEEPSYAGLSYCALGLVGEAGEIANKVKKIARDMDGEINDSVRYALKSELGDVLWYLSQLSTELGLYLSDVAYGNLQKLGQRKLAGTLQGSGDTR